MKTLKTALLLAFFALSSCHSDKDQQEGLDAENETTTVNSFKSATSSDCGYEDGTYAATVDYANSETGYSATYTLDVEVQDCQVVQINFPNGGYVDEDHITYADIDENGNASVAGEDGKSYEVSIDD